MSPAQSMMEVLGSRAGRVLGVDEKKPDADLHSFDQIDWDNRRHRHDVAGVQPAHAIHP